MSDSRSLTIVWEDPDIVSQAARSMKGLEFLQKIASGEVPPPPIMRLINFQGAEVSEGKVVFTCAPSEQHYSVLGMVHGGVAATLLDTSLGCSIHSMLPLGVSYTTLELHINYVRPLTINTGVIRCEGEVIHVGRTVATAQGRIVDATGKLYAHATTTCMILRPTEAS
ncbi:MAG: PaaI family thioesterase [Anaerolineae bacterium]|nr:PaaI family thioesterase [Anaerolineae bacterium]